MIDRRSFLGMLLTAPFAAFLSDAKAQDTPKVDDWAARETVCLVLMPNQKGESGYVPDPSITVFYRGLQYMATLQDNVSGYGRDSIVIQFDLHTSVGRIINETPQLSEDYSHLKELYLRIRDLCRHRNIDHVACFWSNGYTWDYGGGCSPKGAPKPLNFWGECGNPRRICP